MTQPKFDQDFWEQLWSRTLREHADKVARRPPNAHLMAEAANLPPGRALDAGCGHGEDTLWLDWIEGNLATWMPERGHYDLVVCLYVHVTGSVEDLVRRMANAVAPGGTLFLVGHRPIDPSTGAPTTAADQVQVSVEGAVAALDPKVWDLVVAEERRAPPS